MHHRAQHTVGVARLQQHLHTQAQAQAHAILVTVTLTRTSIRRCTHNEGGGRTSRHAGRQRHREVQRQRQGQRERQRQRRTGEKSSSDTSTQYKLSWYSDLRPSNCDQRPPQRIVRQTDRAEPQARQQRQVCGLRTKHCVAAPPTTGSWPYSRASSSISQRSGSGSASTSGCDLQRQSTKQLRQQLAGTPHCLVGLPAVALQSAAAAGWHSAALSGGAAGTPTPAA